MSTNGNNPRLDRIERLIEQRERANREAHARTREDVRRTREDQRRTREDVRRTRKDMRRWVALGVKGARNQRKKIATLEAKAAAYQARTDQNLTEITDKLNGLIGYAGR